jgi:putative restriction endonuclease
MDRRRWTRPEQLLGLHLYWRIPFGQQHSRNPEVIALAEAVARTPGSVAMKLNNFTSLDPEERARGMKGLEGASALDRQTWDEFVSNRELVAAEAEALWENRVEAPQQVVLDPHVNTESSAERRIRLGQAFFRRIVLANFCGRCALTGIANPALLNASHVVGWAAEPAHRLDPSNGIALNRLHDAAFDRHLVTFDDDLRLVIGRRLRETLAREELSTGFLAYEGRALQPAIRRELSPALLERHRAAFAAANG